MSDGQWLAGVRGGGRAGSRMQSREEKHERKVVTNRFVEPTWPAEKKGNKLHTSKPHPAPVALARTVARTVYRVPQDAGRPLDGGSLGGG